MKKSTKSDRRFSRNEALMLVRNLTVWALDSNYKFELAGSLRREKEFVGDVDIIARCDNALQWIWAIGKFGGVPWSMGARMVDFTLFEMPVNVRFFTAAEWGAGLMFLTGSKEFNIECRARAQENGLMLNQYGLYRGDLLIAGKTEKSIFEALGMPYREPKDR